MATFLLTVLIVFALSWALVNSDGAWGVLERIRGNKHIDSFGVLNCVPCTSFWVSIPFMPLFLEAGVLGASIITLGMWASVVVLDLVINNLMVK